MKFFYITNSVYSAASYVRSDRYDWGIVHSGWFDKVYVIYIMYIILIHQAADTNTYGT